MFWVANNYSFTRTVPFWLLSKISEHWVRIGRKNKTTESTNQRLLVKVLVNIGKSKRELGLFWSATLFTNG
jgi:hypothetical protein